MKHLFIILISILLLSFPLYGQETGVLFLSLENGELVYYEEGDDDNEGKYVGEIDNGEPNGQGTFIWSDGTKYVGEYKNGLPNGHGTETWSDGSKYVGEFKDGKWDGQGTITWSDGTKYVGEYKDNKRWNGIYYDQYGNIRGKTVNGKLK
jgi:hypothetical protein